MLGPSTEWRVRGGGRGGLVRLSPSLQDERRRDDGRRDAGAAAGCGWASVLCLLRMPDASDICFRKLEPMRDAKLGGFGAGTTAPGGGFGGGSSHNSHTAKHGALRLIQPRRLWLQVGGAMPRAAASAFSLSRWLRMN